ncbi:TetR family transcriptional regulator [Luteimonas deserti]|uniref:TetR family transcriptional regulator n=1 Tax=Luteimonas deserti TaxID=2752306 RepID=A0A7Z0TY56_9GAMM|nr:TetR family transcriptional regulator [Luteimonas deserti]NYZ62017.1 TetR family transcriptional regulator [Luteimonas deserti]
MALTDDDLLQPIAAALALRPRSSLQELAKAAGISRATLYRFASTREQLLTQLSKHAVDMMQSALNGAELDRGDPRQALDRVTDAFLRNRDLYSFFFTHIWEEAIKRGDVNYVPPEWMFFEESMDAFFLRCQRENFLRFDMPATWLNEVYGAILYGAARAISLGRVAPASAHQFVMDSFLRGVSADSMAKRT